MGKKNIRNGEGYCEMGMKKLEKGKTKLEMWKNIVKWGRIS